MILRKYEEKDLLQIAGLFYDTIHSICQEDYSKKQLNAWATGKINLSNWNNSLLIHYTVVVEENKQILGFGDIDNTGYLDRLYVHKEHQNKGIGSLICKHLESFTFSKEIKTITVYASITAKPFFEKIGYIVIKKQTVKKLNQTFINFLMKKTIE